MRLIIILGYSLSSAGDIQPILKSRLDLALSLCQESDQILVCGKRPPKFVVPNRCETVTEAEAMKQYLLSHGILETKIIKEEDSTTTFGNAFYSFDIVKSLDPESILVVSNEFHTELVNYSFNKIFESKYPYKFYAVPDLSLSINMDEIKQWKVIINHLVEVCYPILFAGVKDGDIYSINSIITSPRNVDFENCIKSLLNLEGSNDIVEIVG